MTVNWQQAPLEDIQRLYTALKDIGVLVQIPAALAERISSELTPGRTLLAADADGKKHGGFTGGGALGPWHTPVIRECAFDTETFPQADAYRLTVDAAMYLGEYESLFKLFLCRAPKPAILCARGETPLATALTVCWLLLGGACATVSLLGACGYASMAEVVMTLILRGKSYLNPHALPAAARAWEALTVESIPPYQPVIGSRVFDVSSGIHVNGLLKDAESFEPFPPELVGRERRIVLDQHSGHSAVAARLHGLGIAPGTLDVVRLTQRIRTLGRESGEVGDAAFAILVRQEQADACA